MIETLPGDWRGILSSRIGDAQLTAIDRFVAQERDTPGGKVHPPDDEVFAAFELTPFESVRAVILGQDPYHEPDQAHGLAFSTRGEPRPPSLRNILKELRAACGYEIPDGGSLEPWARHGVLLLNTVLTVRQGTANSHAHHGWEEPTGAVLDAVSVRHEPVAFLLWGETAKRKGRLVDRKRHVVVERSHPSPLSARHGFLGSKPFREANARLQELGAKPIDWSLG